MASTSVNTISFVHREAHNNDDYTFMQSYSCWFALMQLQPIKEKMQTISGHLPRALVPRVKRQGNLALIC
jgi:hypothetical protein